MIIQTIMDIVHKNPEGGFSEFYFTKSDGVTVSPKRTYSMLFKPWHWVISSGNYYDDINAELDMIENQMKKQFSILYVSMGIVLAIITLIGLVSSRIFASLFTRPIRETARNLEQMSKGDLTLRLAPSRHHNEIRLMRSNMNVFAESICQMVNTTKSNIASLNKVAEGLGTSSVTISNEIQQIADNSALLAGHAKSQQDTVTVTVSTMKAMTDMIAQLNGQIQVQNEEVAQSSAAVEQMIANINSIAETTEKFGSSFRNLSENSAAGRDTIENVIKMMQGVSEESAKLLDTNRVIEDVANQTNLLAMNAAIEAAHAGTAGRGFAVVAEEIRKLSESTTKQSRFIREALTAVMDNISAVTEAMNKAGHMFSGIVSQIASDDVLVEEIRRSMEEQNSGGKQIVGSLCNIKSSTQEILSGSNTMNEEIGIVVKQIADLEKLSTYLNLGTQEIEVSVKTISSSSDGLIEMAKENRSLAETLSVETQKFST